MKYIPLGDRIIVRQITEAEAAEPNKSGILLIDTSRTENEAIVVAIGEGIYDPKLEKHIPTELEIGDRVVHSNLGTWKESIRYDGQDCYVINESNILAYAERPQSNTPAA